MERTSRTATCWAKLPPAVIGFVLYHVAQEAALDHTLAQYATVNKDWQYLFEQFNFRSLDLGPEDLHGFETIVSTHSNRRKWLRTVSLHVVDHEGAHLDGGSAEQPEQQAPRAVVSLLGLLKEWDTDSNLCLALCLSAPTTGSPETGQGTASHQNSAALQSPDRLYQPEEDGLSHMVEQVPAIKAFSIRYEEAQVISSRAVLDLCSRLPKLEELRIHDPHRRNNYTKHFNIAKLAPELPWTLKRLHILGEDSTRKTPKSVCQFLVQRLVWFGMTIGLQELSITTSGYAAEEFFDCFRSMAPGSAASEIRHWPALQSLTLTCSLLRPSATRAAVDPLLHQAGLAALELYLPHLRELRLLSHKAGNPKEVDGFFHYAVTGQGKNVATCVASEHIHMGRLVTDTWRNFARESHRAKLRFSSDTHPPPSLLQVGGLFGEHGELAFEDIQYPRPHWTRPSSSVLQACIAKLTAIVYKILSLVPQGKPWLFQLNGGDHI